MIQLTIPGRPVPWARARKRKGGGYFTPPKQAAHRETLATLIQIEMRALGIERFVGPVALHAVFDYGVNETRIKIHPHSAPLLKPTRCDLDNLIKQIAEGCEDSGLLHDDAQVAVIVAKKVK